MYLFKLWFSLDIRPGVGLLGYYGNSIFSFLWTLLTVFHCVGTSLHSHQQCRSIPFFSRTCFFLYIVYFTGLITEFYFHSFLVAVYGFLRLLSGVFSSRVCISAFLFPLFLHFVLSLLLFKMATICIHAVFKNSGVKGSQLQPGRYFLT